MRSWVIALIAGLAGIAAGVAYGWVINPVKFVDTTPASLRADFRTDYVLMVAEAYHSDHDPELAARRLAVFGSEPPAAISRAALNTAGDVGYAPNDVVLLQELSRAMQAYQPAVPTAGSTP